MAVAVKTSPGSRSTGSMLNPAIISLLGVVYLLVCLGILFKVVPGLWWSAWENLRGTESNLIGGTLLFFLSLGVAAGLVVAGSRILGPNPPAGVRAGTFLGFLTLLLVLLLAR